MGELSHVTSTLQAKDAYTPLAEAPELPWFLSFQKKPWITVLSKIFFWFFVLRLAGSIDFFYLQLKKERKKEKATGTSLVVQALRLHTFTKGDVGSIPSQGTKIPHASEQD